MKTAQASRAELTWFTDSLHEAGTHRTRDKGSRSFRKAGFAWQWILQYHDRCGGVTTQFTNEVVLTPAPFWPWQFNHVSPPCCVPTACLDNELCDKCMDGSTDLCRDGRYHSHYLSRGMAALVALSLMALCAFAARGNAATTSTGAPRYYQQLEERQPELYTVQPSSAADDGSPSYRRLYEPSLNA